LECVDGAEMMRMARGGATVGSSGSARGRFDAFRLAARGEALAGEADMTRRARVRDRLAQAAGAEILEEADWRPLDPSGNSFANVNTLEEYVAARERA